MVPQSVSPAVRGARGGARGGGRKHSQQQPSAGTIGNKAPSQRAPPPRLTHCESSGIIVRQKLSAHKSHTASYSTSDCEHTIPLSFHLINGVQSHQGHHAGLRELMERFGRSLLNETDPPIPGLDKSVLISPRRLHFTLGVMSLASPSAATHPEGTTNPMIQSRTLDDAIRFLENLKPRVDDLLRASTTTSANQAQKIRVNLNSMDTMKLEKDGTAHVLWVGPKDGNSKDITNNETNKLRRVCGKLNGSSMDVR
jgi:hypothetical protein